MNDIKQVEALHQRTIGVEVAKDIKTYYYGGNGHIKGLLTAPWLYRYMKDTPYMVLDKGLRVDFYNDSSKVQSVLTAKRGEYYENTNNITVKDSVVVTTQDGKRLSTSVLHWDPVRQQFYTDSPATLVTPTQIISGMRGLEASADISWYRFKTASGELKMDSGYLSPTPDSLGPAPGQNPERIPGSEPTGPGNTPNRTPAPRSGAQKDTAKASSKEKPKGTPVSASKITITTQSVPKSMTRPQPRRAKDTVTQRPGT